MEAQERVSTASTNVHIPNDSLFIKSLERYRKIRVYLPAGYESSNRSYPVLYMHDGQNLFDDSTSYVGEWGVDETLDSLGMDLIVVGIDNGQEKRMTEYSPWDNERFGHGEGAAYVQFIVDDLKPMIDSTFRTLVEPEHTGIMGSSMGGLISHYAMISYPEVFCRIGIFSPSYWYTDSVWAHTEKMINPSDIKVFMLVGGKEGTDMTDGVRKMENMLRNTAFKEDNLGVIIDEEGEHNERFWRKYFASAVIFLFTDQQ